MLFRKFGFALVIICLLCGCSRQQTIPSSRPQNAADKEKSLYLIYNFPNSYNEGFQNGRLAFSESDRMDDEELQGCVQGIRCIYPISEDSQITDYAWELYDILIEEERIEKEYVPYSAKSYTDGIWRISFLPEEHHGSYYDGKSYSVLISAYDGHIISFLF